MKKLSVVLTLFLCANCLYPQRWLDVGAKGGYGLNLLYNPNVFDDRNFIPKLSYGYMFGGKAGFNFNETHAITLDITSSAFNQSYEYSILNPDSTRNNFSRSIGFNTLDFLLMYRKAKAASYVEIGPQYSTVLKSMANDSQSGSADISGFLNKSYFAAAVGFGGFVVGTENFGILLGIRIAYSLNDIISKEGKTTGFPSGTNYTSYKPSNPLSALFVMELNYDLGYLASAKCGKKTKFLMF